MRDLRARVGLVFQDPDDQLFMPTVARGRRVRAAQPRLLAARRSRSASPRRSPPCGWQDVADRAPHQLSLGQRRRVAIATVLAMRPSLLVLDEPSANLDPRTRRELIELLDEVERTMLVVTHDLPFAATAVRARGDPVRRADRRRRAVPRDPRATTDLLAAHDLELPAGFDLGRVPLRAPADPLSL